MTIQDQTLGRIEVFNVPLPEGTKDVNGTYTPSGRVLVADRKSRDQDDYAVYTLNDDGSNVRKIFDGVIPQHRTANGIRWMCFSDNRRVLLGDYVLECAESLDREGQAALVPVIYPDALMRFPALFRHWSEIIISPDMKHMIWTMLTFTGADNFIGQLVRKEEEYVIEDVYCISSRTMFKADPQRKGYVLPQTVRGGEVKQFVLGGRAVSLVGNSDCLSDSVVEELDTGAAWQFTHTAGYEETAIFSPDETLAICMSPRFSKRTNCDILGLIPLPYSAHARGPIVNAAYHYAIASERMFRKGLIGPALLDVHRTRKEGRAYEGVDLGDPENKFVYYSPMSWAPCGTKALWNESTRIAEPPFVSRLRVVRLLDRKPCLPLPSVPTPDGIEIPYAIPLGEYLNTRPETLPLPYRIAGKASGEVVCGMNEAGWRTVIYDNFSDDAKTFMDGEFATKSPASIFEAGENIIRAKLKVWGEHTGEADFRLTFTQENVMSPVRLSFAEANDRLPVTYGYSRYDRTTIQTEDMDA